MGNFEKLVVLTVLFLSAIVLAVQMSGDDEPLSADPGRAARDLLEGGARAAGEQELAGDPAGAAGAGGDERGAIRPDGGPGAPSDEGLSARPGGMPVLLDSSAGPRAGEGSSGPAARPSASPYGPDSLVIAPGLEETGMEGMLVYELEEETTWEELALRLYGDERLAALLQLNNEEQFEAPEPGAILVPMQDYSQGAGIVGQRRPRGLEASQPAGLAAADASAPVDGPLDAQPPRPDGLPYVVRDGDNLSKISSRFFGTSTRWEEIYQANRDQLDSPDWVKPGMTLVIPGVSDDVAKNRPGVR